MSNIKYQDFHNAIKTLGLISKVDKQTVRDRYLYLSKSYHPDNGGSVDKFQEINNAYHLIVAYMDNYRYALDESEFKNQYPLSEWTYSS
jgi:DnaJ-class molecular chaperone